MKKAVTIFIGFVHDFAAGCWAAAFLAIYRLEAILNTSAGDPRLVSLQREFFYAGLVCIAMIFGAGAGRTFTYAYIGSVYGEESEKLRRKMLIIKHVFLLAIFTAGTVWEYVMIFRP